jgi:hypothetical protein
VPYKPGPQVCFLVEKMADSEKTIVDALSALTEKLTSLEKKVDSYGGDLGRVQVKVGLAMQSISLVQQEQITVAKHLKLLGGSTTAPSQGDGMMGPRSSADSTSSVSRQHPPPPPSPSYNLLRPHHQVSQPSSLPPCI